MLLKALPSCRFRHKKTKSCRSFLTPATSWRLTYVWLDDWLR